MKIATIPGGIGLTCDPNAVSRGGAFLSVHIAPGMVYESADNPGRKCVMAGVNENGFPLVVNAEHEKHERDVWSFDVWDSAGGPFLSLCREAVLGVIRDAKEGHVKDLAELQNSMPSQVAVLCGSGPSLNKFPLKKAKEAGWIICAVNKAVRKVRDMGLLDYAFVVDPIVPADWMGDPRQPGTIISSMMASNASRWCFENDKQYAFDSPEREWAMQPRDGRVTVTDIPKFVWVNSALIASCSAMECLWRMGVRDIILTGHDFSFPGFQYDFEDPVPDACASNQALGYFMDGTLGKGREVLTNRTISRNAAAMRAKILALEAFDGVRVWNTSGGLLQTQREVDRHNIFTTIYNVQHPAVKKADTVPQIATVGE